MSGANMRVEVEHLTRVEGHGNIVLDVKNGEIKKLEWTVVEAPRLFEAMLRGRRWDEVHHIACRICGICSVSHTCASLRATEAAMDIPISDQTLKLRRLIFHGEMIQSHVLHVYLLAAPDLLGVGSVFPLIQTHREVVLRAMRMKKLANDISHVIGGRHVHPISLVPGGFAALPKREALEDLRERLEACKADLEATVGLVKALKLPDFERETEYISLRMPEEYAFYEGLIYSSDAGPAPVEHYREVTNEFVVPHSTAKHARWHRNSYMVGALSRVNNNYEMLRPEAKAAAEAMGFRTPCFNPFMNNVAQVVETAHCVYDAVAILDELLQKGLRQEAFKVAPKAGRGIGVVEAPRGILFHEYEYGDDGRIVRANCIIPTNQNHESIEDDFRALAPKILDRPQDEVRHTLEMLVRAYDPCISCSTHYLDVTFV